MFTRSLQHSRVQINQVLKGGLGTLVLLSTSSCTVTPPTQSVTALPQSNKPVVALVLGGGGSKGLAHVGVIKTLEVNGIKPDLIVGSSVGSLVGSLYASGMTAQALQQLALSTPTEDITDFTLAHQGIIEGIKLKNFVNTQVGQRPIEALPIRFAAVATEKHTQKKTVFTSGDTGLAVQASCSVPNIFIAPRIPEKVGKKYVDGGVSSLVPVDTARALGADVVIAVDVLSTDTTETSPPANKRNIWSLIEQTYSSRSHDEGKYRQTQAEIARADVIIRPAVSHISAIDASKRGESIHAGEVAAAGHLSEIADAIASAVAKPKGEHITQVALH